MSEINLLTRDFVSPASNQFQTRQSAREKSTRVVHTNSK